jgi:predicted lipoprotein with Yx(FWY)xxD motif
MRKLRSTVVVVALLAAAACGPAEDDAAADPAADVAADQERDPSDAEDGAGDDGSDANDAADDTSDDTADDDGSTEDDGSEGDGDASPDGDVLVTTATTELGTILVDGGGMTLYLFDNDTDAESVCYGDCAVTWPPLVGTAGVGGEADAALLGTTEREDGAMQVTYAGLPLYHYAGDEEPGDLTGQAVGGVWWVIGPDGERITDEAAAAPAGRY